MPQVEQIDTFSSQVIWAAICFIFLYIYLARVALPRIVSVLAARRTRIEDDLEKAARLKAEADEAMAAYEKGLADARSEAQTVLRQVTAEMSEASAKQIAGLGDRLAKGLKKAEGRIAEEKRQALDGVRDVAREAAAAAAERLVGMKVGEQQAASAVDAAMARAEG